VSNQSVSENAAKTLEIVCKPCSGGTCPTIYKDASGRIFLQGNKLTENQPNVAIAPHEGVVEIDPSLIAFLRTL